MQNKNHWENVYENKQPTEVSWTQEIPTTSLEFFHQFDLPKSAKIIDIGGGDSKFVDYLVAEGYENVSVLDISAKALEKAQQRLGDKSKNINWIVSDITEFSPVDKFDFWHDRATFHFLTTTEQIQKYLTTAESAINKYLVVATFSPEGPKKCSGLEIKQYSEQEMEQQFKNKFEKIKCKTEDHTTPFQTVQNFTFCSFSKTTAVA